MLTGGTGSAGGLSWVVGAIHRIIQGRCGDGGIVLSILELELELEVGGWWTSTGLLVIAIAKVVQPIVMKRKEWQQKVRLLYGVWVALKLCPETPGGG